MVEPAIVKESKAVLVYIRRIAELQRRLSTLQTSPALSTPVPTDPPHQSNQQITALTAHIHTLETQLSASQAQASTYALDLKHQHEEVFRLTSQLREKDTQIAGLFASLAKLERQIIGTGTYPVGLEEEVRKAVSRNEDLQRELYETQGKVTGLRVRIGELEEELRWPHIKQLAVRRTEPVCVLPAPPHCPLVDSKAALTGAQLDFLQLYRKYMSIRDKAGIEETFAAALGRIKELEEKLAKARSLVNQLRYDIEAVLGWRVELCGQSLFLTMKTSGLSIELVREEGYRAVPGALLTKGLETSACEYLTQVRSWPGFLACTLLTCIDDSIQTGE